MSEKTPPESNILDALSSAIGVECPQCGEKNPSNAEECEVCGAEMPVHHDEPSLSFVHGEGVSEAEAFAKSFDEEITKVPLEKAQNLILLKNTVSRVQKKEISLEKYQENVTQVLNVAREGMELFKTDLIQKQIEKLPDEQKRLAAKTSLLFEKYYRGCSLMLEFDGGDNMKPVLEGLEMVEEALKSIDELQDRTVELARQEAEEEAEFEEEEEEEPEDIEKN